eukprot:TRINITY_DN7829_c0_g1_i2.p1 TRINITY_DN7829_c0_g1~~TRINITY_DN7829_c0_g1_i2.p1  ORF type:complete len:381 (-),score=-0.45 TRINITY_DN7829_c0_g1_i2:1498-2580(-)
MYLNSQVDQITTSCTNQFEPLLERTQELALFIFTLCRNFCSSLFSGSYLLRFKNNRLEKQFSEYQMNHSLVKFDKLFIYFKIVIGCSALLDTLGRSAFFSFTTLLCILNLYLICLHLRLLYRYKQRYWEVRWLCVILHRVVGCLLISQNGISQIAAQQQQGNAGGDFFGIKLVLILSGAITVSMHALGFLTGIEVHLPMQVLSLLSFTRSNRRLCRICYQDSNCRDMYQAIVRVLKRLYAFLIPVVLPDGGHRIGMDVSPDSCNAIILMFQVIVGMVLTTLVILQIELYVRYRFLSSRKVDSGDEDVNVTEWVVRFKSLRMLGEVSQLQFMQLLIAQGLAVCAIGIAIWTYAMPTQTLFF